MSLVVIIDDSATNRNIFGLLAQSLAPDVTVKTFGDPVEALSWLSTNTPYLIITDYKMPQMDAAEFIRRFRAFPSSDNIPVIVITVYEERSFRLQALEAGATDFLTSPVDHHEFITRARNLLDLRKHQLLLAQRADSLERELKNSERSLRDSSERLAQVIDTLPIMIRAVGYDGSVLFVNAYETTFFDVDPASVIGKQGSVLLGEDAWSRSYALDRLVFETGKAMPTYEEEIVDHAAVKRVFLTSKAPLHDLDNKVIGVLTSSLDISARKQTEAHLRYTAQHDTLTDLPNRMMLRERLRSLIARSRRGDHLFALHLIDLDGFKRVNDLLGHTAGDRFLKALAKHMRQSIREADMIARLGGDEFAILQRDVASSEDAALFATRILETIGRFKCQDHDGLVTTASIGVAMHPSDGSDAEDLLRNADLAMYKAKAEGGNSFCFYAADLQARAKYTAGLDAELRQALAEKQFLLYYQPQVDLATGQIVGAEALLRWQRPGKGITTPGAFLARAEENGLILPINEWVLHEACREVKSWHDAGLPRIRIAVNLSPIQFRKRTVPLLVAKVLADTRLDGQYLDLELTESIMMQDMNAVERDLRQLVDLGVHLAIDDFGTGYSSLAYVKRFPVDRIKIDQSFVRNMADDVNDAAIVRAIITLGHSLNVTVVAEGVETADQLARLRAEGCDEIQGYYFGKPMPAADFANLIRGGSPIALRSA
jgi:diguanylate cyclase (GGDEF)-like protein/PAS domain S-box-containing protein